MVPRNSYLSFTQASLVMYELAWKMSRDNNDLLWWAIIGLTEQLLYEKIDRYIVKIHMQIPILYPVFPGQP